MKLYIKNMVCDRCIMVVKQELKKSGLQPSEIRLGEVTLENNASSDQLNELSMNLAELGFEILDSVKQKLIEKIKNLLVQKVQSGVIEEHFSMMDFLTGSIHKNYSQMSRLFTEVEGITIEQYFILQKIEKVKEWLVYDELTLSEIAWKLGYSSVAHLSAQFKNITGLTPSHFKKLGGENRKSLDKI